MAVKSAVPFLLTAIGEEAVPNESLVPYWKTTVVEAEEVVVIRAPNSAEVETTLPGAKVWTCNVAPI